MVKNVPLNLRLWLNVLDVICDAVKLAVFFSTANVDICRTSAGK